jgi:predicted transposase/invertase (TIGR01784 family)
MAINTKLIKDTLDPKIDLIFRALFTKETDCLRDLINSVVHFPKEKEFTQIEVLDPHLFPENGDDKFSIMDIKATSRDGYQFNIEMQMTFHPDYIHRALFYWSRFYSEGLKKAETYTKLLPTISIHILNFELFKDSTSYHQEYAILEKQRHTPLTDHFEMHFLELPKVPKEQHEHLVSWLLFLKNL